MTTTITIPVELELTPRSQAVMAALQKALDPRFQADEPAEAPVANLPAIGAPWPGIEGSAYAGISRGEDGAPDAHLVLLAENPEDMSWHDAMKLAEQCTDGARLPTRFESALLYANLRDRMDTGTWHWTGTQYSEYLAWRQDFGYGGQDLNGKKFEGRVRLVRRFPL